MLAFASAAVTPSGGALAGYAEGAQKIVAARDTLNGIATDFTTQVTAVLNAGVDLAIVSGLAAEWWGAEWSGAGPAGQALFWIGLLLGGSTVAPAAIRGLLTSGRLGIGLLMTISAVGAVSLGYVEEAAALAFLYSIAEALEDKAMDRARGGLRALAFRGLCPGVCV